MNYYAPKTLQEALELLDSATGKVTVLAGGTDVLPRRSVVEVTPAPDNMTPYLFNSVIYDHWAAFDSFNKLKVIADEYDPKYFLTGHDPWIILQKNFG